MNSAEIISKWLEYSNYDPNRKSFNLLSAQYEMHKICENIKQILTFDPLGSIAVLYAKNAFVNLMKEVKVGAFDVLSNPEYMSGEREMWEIFNSPDFILHEEAFLNSFQQLVSSIIPSKMIGNRNTEEEKNVFMGAIDAVVNQLQKLKMDVFKKGGKLLPIENYSVHIHLFERLSECLLAIECAKDGLYLCYINEGGSVDGYFGFMLKNNGNILFLNERLDEAYPGQHKRRRSARYSDDKQYALFPYNFIFSFSEYDRLGYATKHIIDEDKLAFFNMEPAAYTPLIVSMMLINSKYTGFDISTERVKYIDTLLPQSLALPTPGVNALVIPSNSEIALTHREYAIELTSDDILNGTKSKKFDSYSNRDDEKYSYDEYGTFPTGREEYMGDKSDADLFIQLYGAGFELDCTHILESNYHLKRLTSSGLEATEETANVEFVGTKRRLDLIAYQQGRKQLAEYLKDQIAKEFYDFGAIQGMRTWWMDSLLANKEKVIDWCIKCFAESNDLPKGVRVKHQIQSRGRPELEIGESWYSFKPWNKPYSFDYRGRPTGNDYCCAECDSKASVFFVFTFDDWKGISEFVGADNVPKILKGWRRHGHNEHGNRLLSVTDACTGVGTPFESDESRWNPRYKGLISPDGRADQSEMHFVFWIGFSKRTWNRILKEKSK